MGQYCVISPGQFEAIVNKLILKLHMIRKLLRLLAWLVALVALSALGLGIFEYYETNRLEKEEALKRNAKQEAISELRRALADCVDSKASNRAISEIADTLFHDYAVSSPTRDLRGDCSTENFGEPSTCWRDLDYPSQYFRYNNSTYLDELNRADLVFEIAKDCPELVFDSLLVSKSELVGKSFTSYLWNKPRIGAEIKSREEAVATMDRYIDAQRARLRKILEQRDREKNAWMHREEPDGLSAPAEPTP